MGGQWWSAATSVVLTVLPRRLMDEHQLDECLQRPIDAKLESFTRRIEKQLEREVKKMETKLMTEREQHEREIKKLKTKVTDEKEQHEREMKAMETKLTAMEIKLTAMETGLTAEREQHEREMKAMETKLTAALETESGRYKKELVTLMEKIEKIKVYCMFVVWTILGLALIIYFYSRQDHLVGIRAQDFISLCSWLGLAHACKQWYVIQRFDQGCHSSYRTQAKTW